jgi:ABC-type branched-subunit amino acid transport system ATPase component/ABC-type branched-subunit amino acid transport system permease subunit
MTQLLRSPMGRRIGIAVALFIVYTVAITSFQNSFVQQTAALLAFWALVGMSWNIIGGTAGQYSLGQATFVGLGAYTSVLLLEKFGLNPWASLPIVFIVVILAALAIGIPTLRLRAIPFLLVTLTAPLILLLVFLYLGLQEVLIPPHPESPNLYMQWDDPSRYGILLAAAVLVVWVGWTYLDRTRIRLLLTSVKADEDAARSIRVNVTAVKLGAFCVSAIIAGFAGVIYARLNFIVTPEGMFGIDVSMRALIVCLIGGIGRPAGALVGAMILVPITATLDYNLGDTAGGSRLALGVALIIVVLWLPTGVLGRIESRRQRVQREARAAELNSALASEQPQTTHRITETDVESDVLADELREPPAQPLADRAAILEAVEISKRYGGIEVLRQVTLTVREGEFVGLVGPNGAGKSTLFDILTGYQRPTAGQVSIKGQVARLGRPYKVAKLGVRRTFQTARPFHGLTALENVVAGVEGVTDSKAAYAAAEACMDSVGLDDVRDFPAEELLPAQVRLLEVARALVDDPAILLLDEPLAGLTDPEVLTVMRVLREQQQAGRTIVIVDHDIASVASWVDRLLLLDTGRIIADGPPREVMHMPVVREAYLGSRWNLARD